MLLYACLLVVYNNNAMTIIASQLFIMFDSGCERNFMVQRYMFTFHLAPFE